MVSDVHENELRKFFDTFKKWEWVLVFCVPCKEISLRLN